MTSSALTTHHHEHDSRLCTSLVQSCPQASCGSRRSELPHETQRRPPTRARALLSVRTCRAHVDLLAMRQRAVHQHSVSAQRHSARRSVHVRAERQGRQSGRAWFESEGAPGYANDRSRCDRRGMQHPQARTQEASEFESPRGVRPADQGADLPREAGQRHCGCPWPPGQRNACSAGEEAARASQPGLRVEGHASRARRWPAHTECLHTGRCGACAARS